MGYQAALCISEAAPPPCSLQRYTLRSWDLAILDSTSLFSMATRQALIAKVSSFKSDSQALIVR